MIAVQPHTEPTLKSVKPQVDLTPVLLVHSAHFLRIMDATLNFCLSQSISQLLDSCTVSIKD